MRTLEQIQADVNQAGRVTRADIYEVLSLYKDKENAKANVGAFLGSLNEGVVSAGGVERILDDLDSYPIEYE